MVEQKIQMNSQLYRSEYNEKQNHFSSNQHLSKKKSIYHTDSALNEKAIFKYFLPKEKLFYCYIIHKYGPFNKIARLSREKLGINYSIDIQRICLHPKTQKICTFFGFSTQEQLQKATENQNLIKSSFNKKIYIYQEHISDLELESIRQFFPKKDLFYVYFIEKTDKTVEKYCITPSELFGLKNASDIQRNCFYPETNIICTFVGFSSLNKLNKAIQNKVLIHSSINKKLFIFQNNIFDLELMFTRCFFPKSDLFYIYFVEKINKNVEKHCVKPSDLFGLRNASNIQRNCFYPGTNSVYTFIGFESLKKLHRAIDQTSLKTSAFNQLIYGFQLDEEQIFQFDSDDNSNEEQAFQFDSDDNSNEEEMFLLESSEMNQIESENYFSNETFENNDFEDIENDDEEENRKEFIPNDEFYYLYFKIKNQESERKKFYEEINQEMKNIKDIQEGHFKEQNDKYTFLGFSQSIERNHCFKELESKYEHYLIEDLQNLEEDYSSNSEETEYENSEIYDDKNERENSNKQNIANKRQTTNHNSKIDKQNDTNATNLSIKLPKFPKYKKNDLFFNVFSPKEKYFYCFFAEKTKPNHNILIQKYENSFQINNASDIQRFCFYPGTKNIYTFVGFSDKNKMIQEISKSPILSFSFRHKIYSYPFINNKSLIKISKSDLKLAKRASSEKWKFNYTIEDKKASEKNIEFQETKEIQSTENKQEIKDQKDCVIVENQEIKEDHEEQIISDVSTNDGVLLNRLLFELEEDSDERNRKEFIPNDEFYYLYFKIKNQKSERKKFYEQINQEMKNIKDIQEGHFKEQNDKYTFLGFSQSIERNHCFKELESKYEHYLIEDLQNFEEDYSSNSEETEYENSDINDDDDDDDDDDYDDNSEYFEEIGRLDEYLLNVIHHVKRDSHPQPNEKIRIKK